MNSIEINYYDESVKMSFSFSLLTGLVGWEEGSVDKHLPCEPEGRSSDPQNPFKSLVSIGIQSVIPEFRTHPGCLDLAG